MKSSEIVAERVAVRIAIDAARTDVWSSLHNDNADADEGVILEQHIFFGQLQHIFVIRIKASPALKLEKNITLLSVLAQIYV